MKPALVIASITGGLVLAGAAAVGTVYLVSHRPAPMAQQAVAQATPPEPSPPLVAQETPRESRPTMRRRHPARVCPVPATYRHHYARSIVRPIIRTRLHILPPAYGPPPVYDAPPPRDWGARPYWRAGWRGPRWDGLPPRFAYARGPYDREPYGHRPWAGW